MANKQKAWRKAAAAAKREFVLLGKHNRGVRYGRFVKAALGGTRIAALPSSLFLNLMAHAGLNPKAV